MQREQMRLPRSRPQVNNPEACADQEEWAAAASAAAVWAKAADKCRDKAKVKVKDVRDKVALRKEAKEEGSLQLQESRERQQIQAEQR